MKGIKILIAAFCAVAILTSCPAFAGEKVIRDANGNKWVIDTETAATPGAGSGSGAVIAAVDDTLAGYEKHKIDLQLGLSAVGSAADDSSDTETGLTSFALLYRPVTWFRTGPSVALNMQETSTITFGWPMGFKLNRNPWATYNFWLALDILPKFTVRTDEPVDTSRTSAWSYVPTAEFKIEIPKGVWSLEGGLGVGFPFSLEGVTDEAINNAVKKTILGVNVALNVHI